MTADVQTPNCTPAGLSRTCGSQAQYCNPPGVECACGVDCADGRANYCRMYAPGGVCMDDGTVAGDQGLPGQGPIFGSAQGDLINAFG
jgi:hypothetical protein